MKKENMKKIVVALLILFLLVVFLLLLLLNEKLRSQVTESVNNVVDVIVPKKCNYDLEAIEAMWKENKEINDDYVGQIIFDSGLINVPFVQGFTNDTYLRTDWKTMQYDIEGTVFMDYLNRLDDRNITIYGHYVYPKYDPERNHMFTPLEKLIEKDNYNENKHLIIAFEDGIREYDVAAVYFCRLSKDAQGEYAYTEDALQYYWRNINVDMTDDFNYDNLSISENYFKTYKQAVTDSQFYSTGVNYGTGNKYVTLQTCVQDRDDLREIIICKETARFEYPKAENQGS